MPLFEVAIPIILIIALIVIFARTSLKARGYHIYVPTTYHENDTIPLMIALHGMGGNWRRFSKYSGLTQSAEEQGYIVAFPNGFLRQWNDGSRGWHYEDDVEIIMELIELVATDYNIDRERIYLVGFSNGGTLVYKAACEEPQIFAGIASVGGTMRIAQPYDESARTSVIIVHGTADKTSHFVGSRKNRRYSIPETAKIWAKLNHCDLSQVPEYDESHFQDRISTYHYKNSPHGHQVMMYLIEDFPHTWPGGAEFRGKQVPDKRIDTPRIIWNFFQEVYESRQQTEEVVSEGTEAMD